MNAEERKRPLDLDPERADRVGRKHVAVVDLGSNSVRLVIYDSLSRAPFPRFNEKSLCHLGEGLRETGQLREEAIEATVRAVSRFAAIAMAMDVERIDLIATEAIRKASNGQNLIDQLFDETGLHVRLLSEAEEARFAAYGVISGFYRPRGLVGDMGGGSLELAEVAEDHVGERWVSLPVGALPVTRLLEEHGKDAKNVIDEILGDRLPPFLTEPVLYMVGGGWRALARVHMALTNAPVKVAHGYELDYKEIRDFAKKVWRMPIAEIADLPDVPSRRIKTLPAAALVLDRVLKKLRPERIVVSALGLREGWLYAHLPDEERLLDPVIEGAQNFGLMLARVPSFAPALVCWTANLFPGEVHREKRLRVAACALSDIAWSDHRSVQAQQSFDRIIRFPFVGINHGERLWLAATVYARYSGDFDAPILEPARAILSSAQLRQAEVLGRAMLLAYRFSGSVPEILKSARLIIEAEQVRLETSDAIKAPDSDAVQTRLRQLAKALGLSRGEIIEVAGSDLPDN
ncbi:MAG: Ppx/GppA family phosphatase [Geminicoccales bacterium]